MYLILITAVFVQQCESSEDLSGNLRGSSGQKWLPGNNGLYDETLSGDQDAMKEVSGTEKGLVSNIKKGAVAGGKAAAKVVESYAKSGAWRNFLPGNNPFYDENPSGEQAAMQEVVGNGKHYPRDWHKWLPGNNGLYDETPSGEQDAMQEVVGNGKHYPRDWHKWLPGNNGLYDENSSGEQDAMQEVVGNGKHYPKDWHKWLPGNNGLYDENPSDEQ